MGAVKQLNETLTKQGLASLAILKHPSLAQQLLNAGFHAVHQNRAINTKTNHTQLLYRIVDAKEHRLGGTEAVERAMESYFKRNTLPPTHTTYHYLDEAFQESKNKQDRHILVVSYLLER